MKKNLNQTSRLESQDAVIINPRYGHSYAEVLKSLRTNTNPEDINIKSIRRRTMNATLLLQLAKGEKITETFSEAIR